MKWCGNFLSKNTSQDGIYSLTSWKGLLLDLAKNIGNPSDVEVILSYGSDHQYSSSVRPGLIWMWSAIKHRTQPMLLTVKSVIQLYWAVHYTFDIADSSNNLQVLKTLGWVANMFGIFFVMAGHEHYSIDVFIAFYLSTRFVISHSEKFSFSFC